MGNCQAAEAVAVVIQHPSGGGTGGDRVERAHGEVSAATVMADNPGHYVAAVVAAAQASAPAASARRRLKLLRPDDTLVLGGVYRLVSFEEVLREFVSKRHAMLSRVVIAAADDEEDASMAADGRAVHRRRDGSHGCDAPSLAPESDSALAKEPTSDPSAPSSVDDSPPKPEPEPEPDPGFDAAAMAHGMVLGGRFGLSRQGQWRPALPSIAEGSVVC